MQKNEKKEKFVQIKREHLRRDKYQKTEKYTVACQGSITNKSSVKNKGTKSSIKINLQRKGVKIEFRDVCSSLEAHLAAVAATRVRIRGILPNIVQ